MVTLAGVLVVLLVGSARGNENAVGQLPVMGWSGYNAFMQNSGHCDAAGASGYNQSTFVESMEALQRTGLQALGYQYVNADDCWIAENRTSDGRLAADPTRFPSGMAWLADQAHSRGFKLGLYAAASRETCRQYPGSQGFEAIDADTFVGWGADFVKLDSCGGVLANGTESWDEQYGKWSAALNSSGRQVVFSCSWAVYFADCAARYAPSEWGEHCGVIPWEDGLIADRCHLWRYGSDLNPTWHRPGCTLNPLSGGGCGGVGDVIQFASSFFAANWRSVTGPGAGNDPDFLVVGCPTDGPCGGGVGDPPLSDVEQRTQMSMWCLLGAPLIIGSDVRSLSRFALSTLSRPAAIAINQDVLVARPRVVRVTENRTVQLWVRELHGGDVAVAVVNLGDDLVTTWLSLADIVCVGCAPVGIVDDVWSDELATVVEGGLQLTIKSHESRLFRIVPKP